MLGQETAVLLLLCVGLLLLICDTRSHNELLS